MRLLPFWLASVVAFASAFAAGAADTPEALQKDLAKAKSAHANTVKHADEKLLAAIAAEIETVRKSSLKADLRFKLIGILEKETELFEKSSWTPISERLHKVSIAYMKALNAADKSLDAAYDKYISFLLTAKDTAGAKKVLEEKNADLPKRLMIRFEMEDGTYWRLYSDESTAGANSAGGS